MNRKMKKTNAKLSEARKYVAAYPVLKPVPVIKPVKPKSELEPELKGIIKIESAKITKLEKGYFFVTVSYKGKQHEIQKRFKSTTKAQEWILKHEYVEL